jgi:hypothetical protein
VKLGISQVSSLIGYRRRTIDKTLYLGHRLAWFYMTGEWPQHEIDHIAKPNVTPEEAWANKSDNRWCNLGEATRGQNMANSIKRKDNKSGMTYLRGFNNLLWQFVVQWKSRSLRNHLFEGSRRPASRIDPMIL